MEKLSAKKKVAVVRQYLSGLSYNEIAAKTGVSKGTVANVVTDLKVGEFPEVVDLVDQIELLRELSLDLKRSKLTPGQCAMGLIVLTRIGECRLDPGDIDRWSPILKSAGSEAEVQELVSMISSIQEVQKRTGLGLEDLDNKVHELEKKAADLEPMSEKHDDYLKQVAELTKQREDLTGAVAGLEEKYQLLTPLVEDLEKRERDLSRRIKNMDARGEKAEAAIATLNNERQSLQDIGFSLQALAEFSQRIQSIAQRHHISAAGLRDRLLEELENLSQGLGLETLVQRRQVELKEQERALALAKQERENLKAVLESLKQEKTSLEGSIKNTREKVSQEIAKIIPAARDTIKQVVEELHCGHNDILAEVRRLRDEALQLGIEVGQYKEMLQSNQWLSDLLALVRGEEGIEGKRVRPIILLVLRGALAWLRQNQASDLRFSTLSYAVANLIGELEKWKA
jgi:DNA repair exonuclease SbcCD ATPase subunit